MNNNVTEKMSDLKTKFSELEGFRKLWVIVAIVLAVILFLLLLLGKAPWCDDCNEDDPDLTSRLGLLEKENVVLKEENALIASLKKENEQIASLKKENEKITLLQKENAQIVTLKKENSQIATLKSNIAELTKSKEMLAGLQANMKALETENATINVLKKRIVELETQSADVGKKNLAVDEKNASLMKRISNLEEENNVIADLKTKIKELETEKANFAASESNGNALLLEKISNLEKRNFIIPTLAARLKDLESKEPTLKSKIAKLQEQNSLISGLKAKIATLEAVDINVVDAQETKALMQKITTLESEKPVLMKRIVELEQQNGLIPGLKAKIEALESVDINFVKKESTVIDANLAKLYFEPGSSRFPTDANQSMADLIVHLGANETSKVKLSGFHDATGNARWNVRLATKRSDRVKQLLVDAGIAEDRIIVEKPTHTLGTGLPEEARRVEVRIITE